MTVGDPGNWNARFRSVDDRLLERIVAVWPRCVSLLKGQPEEDAITINLIALLLQDEIVRRIVYWIEYQFEPFGYTAAGVAFSKGKIDMAVLLSQDRGTYLAYECKRLNVHYNGSRQSLATVYVTEGLMRFVTGQYAEHLEIGGMLGYVMDGDCISAVSSVQAAIQANPNTRLRGSPRAFGAIGRIERFSSRHLKQTTATEIEIRHALLPFT